MESPNDNNGPTTSDADAKNVQRIKESLASSNASNSHSNTAPCGFPKSDDLPQNPITKVKEVSIEEGANKYVLVTGRDENNEEKVFVYSRISANYHGEINKYITQGGERGGGGGGVCKTTMLYVVCAEGWGGLKGCFRFNMRVCQPPITRPPPNKRALSLPPPDEQLT
jgi:hypothetical protein